MEIGLSTEFKTEFYNINGTSYKKSREFEKCFTLLFYTYLFVYLEYWLKNITRRKHYLEQAYNPVLKRYYISPVCS